MTTTTMFPATGCNTGLRPIAVTPFAAGSVGGSRLT